MKQSAGILLYKKENEELKFLLVHPGGPFWAKKDKGAWTIPKGELSENENALDAAKREFFEETGTALSGKCIELKPVKQKGGKLVLAWAAAGELDVEKLNSNTFEIEWPPRSGKLKIFPEVDKAAWFTAQEALEKILPAQQVFIHELTGLLK